MTPVTTLMLVRRINRRLSIDAEEPTEKLVILWWPAKIYKTRGVAAFHELGRYYMKGTGYGNNDKLLEVDINLETLGREIGCLEDFESVVEDQLGKRPYQPYLTL